jgi:hypothetical protein
MRPVPLRPTDCGLPPALSNIVRVPVLVPASNGLKLTEITQLAPVLTAAPQVLVWEKLPPVAMLEIISEAFPVLIRVTGSAALVVPTD